MSELRHYFQVCIMYFTLKKLLCVELENWHFSVEGTIWLWKDVSSSKFNKGNWIYITGVVISYITW